MFVRRTIIVPAILALSAGRFNPGWLSGVRGSGAGSQRPRGGSGHPTLFDYE